MEKKFNYEEAVSKLEEIVRKMESGEQNIDSICEQLKTAKQLIMQGKAHQDRRGNQETP